MSFVITGTGSAQASERVTNSDLEKIMDTSDAWIREKSGIAERRMLGEGETLSDLCVKAAQSALNRAGRSAAELDLIICATVTSDYVTPSMACAVQKRIGASCPAFDINAGCSGFIYGLDIAASYFRAGSSADMKILVIGADAISRIIDMNDRTTAVLFGDAAGACILEKGDGLENILISAKGNTDYLVAMADERKLYMKGQKVFQFAVGTVSSDIKKLLEGAGKKPEDVDLFILHQANRRIIESAVNRLGIPKEKFPMNIAETGNTSAASVPLLLDQCAEKGMIRKGNLIVLSAFGAGLTSGAALIRWSI